MGHSESFQVCHVVHNRCDLQDRRPERLPEHHAACGLHWKPPDGARCLDAGLHIPEMVLGHCEELAEEGAVFGVVHGAFGNRLH